MTLEASAGPERDHREGKEFVLVQILFIVLTENSADGQTKLDPVSTVTTIPLVRCLVI